MPECMCGDQRIILGVGPYLPQCWKWGSHVCHCKHQALGDLGVFHGQPFMYLYDLGILVYMGFWGSEPRFSLFNH